MNDTADLLPHGEAGALQELARDPQVRGRDLDPSGFAPRVGHPERRQLEGALHWMGRIRCEVFVVHAPVLLHP
jgi:hypothetical protein